MEEGHISNPHSPSTPNSRPRNATRTVRHIAPAGSGSSSDYHPEEGSVVPARPIFNRRQPMRPGVGDIDVPRGYMNEVASPSLLSITIFTR